MTTATSRSWGDHARDELRRSGARTGGAREAVITYLADQNCCVSAQELFDGLRQGDRAVGIASVYRVLEQLADLGLLHRVDLGGGTSRFEPALPGGEHHHHLVCNECGRVEMFDDATLERTLTRVARARGYELARHDVVLHGVCGDCRPGLIRA
jgi:Fur family transcriptional regulator, ferric uptake regulator